MNASHVINLEFGGVASGQFRSILTPYFVVDIHCPYLKQEMR